MQHKLIPATATEWSRRVARPWRAVFVLYVLALTVASNWPGMHFRIGQQVSFDKLVHALGCGVFAVLLWRTRWLRTRWQVVLIVVLFAIATEMAQVLPILRRAVSIDDIVSGLIGVLLLLAWWWAIAPIGGPAGRLRQARRAYVVGAMFLRPWPWIVSAGAAVIGAVVLGGITWMVLRLTGLHLYVVTSLIAAAFTGALAGMHVAAWALSRRPQRTLSDNEPCFACGASCRGSAFDGFGQGQCPTCAAPIHRGQWGRPVRMSPAAVRRGLGSAAIAAASVLVVVACVYGVVRGLSSRVDAADHALRWWETQPPSMRYLIGFSVLTLALAAAVRVYRVRQATLDDRQHLRCRGCDHELGKPDVVQGLGRCQRCGAAFLHIPSPPEAIKAKE